MPAIRLEMRINTDVFRTLAKLPFALAKKTAPRMVRHGAKILNKAAESKTPVGGPRKGEKSGVKHLKDTYGISRTRKYKNGQLILVASGPEYPPHHAHLVHEGFDHWRGGRVRGNDFYQRAYDTTEAKIWVAQLKMAQRAVMRHFRSIKKTP